MDQMTLNKQLGNNLNKDIINASISLSSFPFSGCFQVPTVWLDGARPPPQLSLIMSLTKL
jgi:hypothetical protein